MSIESNMSGHWTDEQLIAHFYGVGPADGHVDRCDVCQDRALAMEMSRASVEAANPVAEVSFERLAAQRRRVYVLITEPIRWWSNFEWRRWAPAGAAALLLGGGLLIYQENQTIHAPASQQSAMSKVSDAELSRDVGRMASSFEPEPTAPLQALFQE